MSTDTSKWSRRRWLAELGGTDLREVTEYQPTRRAREGRLPILEEAGVLFVVALPEDSEEALQAALSGRKWRDYRHWKKPAVRVFEEQR